MSSSAARNRTVAVILAGGTGQRVGLEIPKQLLKIAGKSILEHTLHIFENASEIDDIVIMMAPDHLADAERTVARAGLRKVSKVLAGGATRSGTTSLAIQWVTEHLADGEDCNLLIHDAVRPLLSGRVVEECVAAMDRYRAVDVAIPSSDTVVVTRAHGEDGEFITEVPDRARLRRGQTPQGFRLSTIRRAYELALADPAFQATDDCSVVVKYLPDVPVHVVMGDEYNMKVTQPVDVFIADKLFQLSSRTAPAPSGEDFYREHLAGRTVVVFGEPGGVGGDIARLAAGYGARVFALGRSTTGTLSENPEHVADAFADVYAETGRIDHVVNTTGVISVGRLSETDDETLQEALAVNYLAPVNIARAAFKYLEESQGQLLFFTSNSYTRGRAGYSLYSSTRAAIVNLTQALAEEWEPDGIRVNCLNPGTVTTPARTRAFSEGPESSRLSSESVAGSAMDVLLADMTGHVVDARKQDAAAHRSSFDQAIASVLSEQSDMEL